VKKKKKKGKVGEGLTVLASNRAASHEFHLLRKLEAGIALTGPEVKSARGGRVHLREAYARIRNGEAFLCKAHFGPYSHARCDDYDPTRTRKLLLHSREIRKLARETESASMTLVPTRLYLKKGRIKVEIALARGKRAYDKRESSRRKEMEREMARARGSRTRL
jgi:SsrA-binding protein